MYSKQAKIRYARHLRKHQTKAERALWWLVLLGYRRQVITEAGYIADFYHRGARLVIEVDGSVHSNVIHKRADKYRDGVHKRKRIRTLRLSNEAALKSSLWLMVQIALYTVVLTSLNVLKSAML